MTDLAWTAVRADTIDRFHGQTPRPEDEAPIIDVFEQHPQLVLRAIDETAKALDDGKVTWAWSVLRARLERGTTAIREATADTSNERARRIRNAENWIRNAGIHYDLDRDIEAELFGDDITRGRLHDYRNDQQLRTRLLELWHQQRPRGIQAERDHLEWAAKCKHDLAAIQALTDKNTNDEFPAETPDPIPA